MTEGTFAISEAEKNQQLPRDESLLGREAAADLLSHGSRYRDFCLVQIRGRHVVTLSPDQFARVDVCQTHGEPDLWPNV